MLSAGGAETASRSCFQPASARSAHAEPLLCSWKCVVATIGGLTELMNECCECCEGEIEYVKLIDSKTKTVKSPERRRLTVKQKQFNNNETVTCVDVKKQG